jgi:hypothetical protein
MQFAGAIGRRVFNFNRVICAVGTSDMGKKKNFYAVARGRRPGIYESWGSCREEVDGYKGCLFKGFSSRDEAVQYLRQNSAHDAEPARRADYHDYTAGEDATYGGRGHDRPSSYSAASARFGNGARSQPEPRGQPRYDPRAQQRYESRAANPAAAVSRHCSAKDYSTSAPAALACDGAAARSARRLRLEFDGACKSNPGPSGFGAALYDADTDQVVAEVCAYMGDTHTNNQAEYAGLIAGLQASVFFCFLFPAVAA